MNTEEKARAYDEALKRAKKATQAGGDVAMDIIQYIFPELVESEDERIRKEIKHHISLLEFYRFMDASKEECLTWLEKQKECVADSSKTSTDEDESIRKFLVDYFTPYKIGNVATKLNGVRIDDILNYLERQKELPFKDVVLGYPGIYFYDGERMHFGGNPAMEEKQEEPHYTKRNALFDKCVENCDSKTVEEVNKRVDDIMNMPELSAFEQALTNFIGDWEDDEERWPSKFVKKHGKHILDMAKEELKKEQNLNPSKSVGLKEQKLIEPGYLQFVFDDILALECAMDIVYRKGNEQKLYEALKSLHSKLIDVLDNEQKEQKEQRPAEWSEEDEEMLNSCISSIEESKENRYAYKENDGDTSYDREIAWLKSLRPQPHWKPSEEQMTALERTIHLSNFGTEENRRKALGSLYEQLKKLGAKEEPEYYQHFDPDC